MEAGLVNSGLGEPQFGTDIEAGSKLATGSVCSACSACSHT
jgi:hypothetical protein